MLTNEHLHQQLWIVTTNLKPNIATLSEDIFRILVFTLVLLVQEVLFMLKYLLGFMRALLTPSIDRGLGVKIDKW
jgi:hypothetical protein